MARIFLCFLLLYSHVFAQNSCNDVIKIFFQDPPVEIKRPVDWIKNKKVPNDLFIESGSEEIHEKFFRRNELQKFSIGYLNELENLLRSGLDNDFSNVTSNIFKYQLALTLVQNVPTRGRVLEAITLLEDSLRNGKLPASFKKEGHELLNILDSMIEGPIKKDKQIKQVHLGVYNRCPYCCKGCYFNFRDELQSLNSQKAIVDRLKNAGVEEIIITGGDPALWNDLPELVDYIRHKNLKVAIDSTAYTMTDELARRLSGKISFFGIPLDGADNKTIGKFRRGKKDILEKTKEAISIMSKYDIPVKINTTANKYNINDLLNIAKYISSLETKQWGWSIFQWWSQRSTDRLFEEMFVENDIFMDAIDEVKRKFPDLNIRAGTVEDRSLSYFHINTDNTVENFFDGLEIGTTIIGDLDTQSVEEIVNSPLLRADSAKFSSWLEEPAGTTKNQ